MFRKILTHVIILTLTALPVQVITAGVESSSMQMSMAKVTQAEQKCLHTTSASGDQEITKMSCCDDVSHQCESCGDCPQAVSAMIILPLQTSDKTYSLNTQKFFTSHLLLNGVPQNNLLRPPRTLI